MTKKELLKGSSSQKTSQAQAKEPKDKKRERRGEIHRRRPTHQMAPDISHPEARNTSKDGCHHPTGPQSPPPQTCDATDAILQDNEKAPQSNLIYPE